MGHSQDILAAQRALVEDDDLRDELGLDDDEAVTACPTCESASIEYHAGTAFGGEPASAPWTCQDCGTDFEAPIERSPERESGSCRHGPAKSLVDAEPDDIRTDGGVDLDEHDQLDSSEGYPGTSAADSDSISYPFRGDTTATATVESPWTHMELDESGALYSIEECWNGKVQFLLKCRPDNGSVGVLAGLDPSDARRLGKALLRAADHAEEQAVETDGGEPR
ncbi:hypothetical protein [Haloglomus salinum]|uniref:hypothetical protein n=1 Tax=Haloglomus salinum TaxID=2962673 RepID=UPI0020CA1619|nr:hypothetical protein [Haloglomus salinum]